MKQYKINVKPISTGDSTLTIVTQDSQCYTNPADVSVSAQVKKVLTPQELSTLATSGQAANSLAIGDLFPVTFNGALSDGLTLNDQTFYATIIGVIHNPEIEGYNHIHFKCPYDEDGTQLAFVDNAMNSEIGYSHVPASGVYFNMNNSINLKNCAHGYNAGGYIDTNMKKNIMPKMKAAIESDWRSVIRPCIKYSDNNTVATGDVVPDTASNVTASQEDLWLLDEFEYFGERTYANSACQNFQWQYQYYINGNPKAHLTHIAPSSTIYVWERSACVSSRHQFCCVHYVEDDIPSLNSASLSMGVTFGFTL